MKLLIFDIDGTLTHLGGATRAAFDAAFRTLFAVPAKIEGIPMHGRTDWLIFRDCFAETGLDGDWKEAYVRFQPVYISELPAKIELSTKKRLLPGVTELLESLNKKSASAALALGTGNMEAGARVKIGYFGLNHYFPVGGFGDGHDHRSGLLRDAVLNANDYFGRKFESHDTWIIGDTPFDIQGGKAIGAKTLGVATGGAYSIDELRSSGADVVLEDLSDVNQVFAALAIE